MSIRTSPRSSHFGSGPDNQTSGPPSASGSASKSRRTVRMFTQLADDSSSSDEGVPDKIDAEPPSHPRASSYPNTTSPTTRMAPMMTQAKLNRAATYSATRSTGLAPPSGAGPSNYQQWKSKYRSNLRARASISKSRGTGLQDEYQGGVGSDDEEEEKAVLDAPLRLSSPPGVDLTRIGVGQPKSVILVPPPPEASSPDSVEGKERLEWQSMLGSVLLGDILKGESSRIGVERPSSETYRKELGDKMWWEIRARLRGRREEEERRRVEQRRNRVVDIVLDEVARFTVKKSHAGVARRLSAESNGEDQGEGDKVGAKDNGDTKDESHPNDNVAESSGMNKEGDNPLKTEPESSEASALDQVSLILEKLSVIEGLYPHQHAFRADKPLYASESIQSRVNALTAWYTVVTQLQAQLHILQAWTGTDDLDITRPNTTKEKPLVGIHPLDAKARAHSDSQAAADNSTFVERVLKEDSLQRTFERRIFGDHLALVENAKQTVMEHSPVFTELELPDFQYELVRLIGFPGRLIIEALKTRLNAAARLVDPDIMVIDDMIDNFRVSISLAVLIRRQYEEITAPDADHRWVIPDCLAENYDDVLLDGLKMFFKLLHWKLKSGSKSVSFRETEVLEDEWEFLYDAAESVVGGDLVVAESLCSLTHKLMVRIINYFDKSLRMPGDKHQPTVDLVNWYSKVLDATKMRYRKLQRFARRLTQRLDNSAEYTLDDVDVDQFIEYLQDSGHFLVYTNHYEEYGTYIIADGSLWERPSTVRQLLFRAFFDIPTHREGEEEDIAEYLLLISPRQNFAWTAAVMTLTLDRTVEFGLEDNRVRLIADGPVDRLNLCKLMFSESFIDEETGESAVVLDCIVEQQAHLPRVQKELKKIARSGHRLSEYIVESAAQVKTTLRGVPGTHDLIQNWFTFASDHGSRVGVYMDHMAWARFSRLLMRLAISWLGFICDSCDPTDRKTFRWTVNALEYAMMMTRGNNILHLDANEFASYRARVGNCMTLLISHFDILGARSSIEAKKEAERLENLRRMQRLNERDDEEDMLPSAAPKKWLADRSLRLVREERLRLIQELEKQRAGMSSEQHLIGQVLDEQVSEDRALVFLAASSSNISLRWQQGGFIGGGANGSVYMGFNLDSGGIMAVKEIRVQDLTNSPALYKQIKDEADVMQMLSHPNIVEYYGIEVHRDKVYIFEEYCPGGSMANLLEHGRVEDEDVIMVYTWQMLQGLAYLHSKGVEHRDVKPDTKVIIKGNRTMAKTRAFSKARTTDPGPAVMNSLAGTPMYIAPEVIKGGAGRLGAADIWSMGCVVLEIATGRKPWSNLDNEWAIMFHIGIATQHPPLPEPGQLSEMGIDFIEQCLILDPEQRPSALDLMHHPWMAPMMDMSELPENSPSVPSLTPTLIDQAEVYASHLAELAKVAEGDGVEDLASFSSTPVESNSGSGQSQ